MQRWSASCALCHASGVAGAPRVDDTAAWQPRLAKGRAALLRHTVEGYNRMPPLGYCMSCEADDFVSMIEFMAGLAQGELE
jgi:cytochrome c5